MDKLCRKLVFLLLLVTFKGFHTLAYYRICNLLYFRPLIFVNYTTKATTLRVGPARIH